ncbi:MAG TPA: hypothetical protein VGM29_16405 [Polyangiaceae bacterium]
MRDIGVAFCLLMLAVGCSASSAGGSGQGPANTEATCHYPSGVSTDASAPGCHAVDSAKICQVSNGATVLPDGGVTGGTETCQSVCATGDYELTCLGSDPLGPVPAPLPSLGCQVVPLPTPSNELFYCCPCAS